MGDKTLNSSIEKVLVPEEELAAAVKKLADKINEDYKNEEVVLAIILKGSLVFATDLMRKLTMPVTIDFMSASSYGNETKSTGKLKINKDLDEDIDGLHCLIVEDIIDSGNTLSMTKKMLEGRNPASLKLCTLLDKPDRRETEVNVDYTGFTIPDAFVVGFGLDYAQKYRNLPYIGILDFVEE